MAGRFSKGRTAKNVVSRGELRVKCIVLREGDLIVTDASQALNYEIRIFGPLPSDVEGNTGFV